MTNIGTQQMKYLYKSKAQINTIFGQIVSFKQNVNIKRYCVNRSVIISFQ